MVEHYSNKIQNVIQKELFNAKQSIRIVVAWFTNDLLFQPLVLKQQAGVKVEIILNRDEINDSEENGIDFNELVNVGGIVRWNETKQLMHDKFCIIDDSIVIFGSYNWTNKAEYNEESITVSRSEAETIRFYLDKYRKLSEKYPAEEVQNKINIFHNNQTTDSTTNPNQSNTGNDSIDIASLSRERSKKPYIQYYYGPTNLKNCGNLPFYHSIEIVSLGYVDKMKSKTDIIIAKSNPYFYFVKPSTFRPIRNVEFTDYLLWHDNGKGIMWLGVKGKWGLYDAVDEKFVLPPICDQIMICGGKYTAIIIAGKWGLINSNGNIVLECKYDKITYDRPSYYLLIDYNGKVGKFRDGELVF